MKVNHATIMSESEMNHSFISLYSVSLFIMQIFSEFPHGTHFVDKATLITIKMMSWAHLVSSILHSVNP